MVRSGTPEPAGGDQSLGDLVSLATKDVSQLVRYEIELAMSELRSELKRVAVGAGMFAIAAFFGILILFSPCFAYAYLLHWAGAWGGMGAPSASPPLPSSYWVPRWCSSVSRCSSA